MMLTSTVTRPAAAPENLTQARTRCGLDEADNPPAFHEIRSLSGRLFEAHYGEVFTQRLLVIRISR